MCGDVLVILCRYCMVKEKRKKRKKKKKEKKRRKKEKKKKKEKKTNATASLLYYVNMVPYSKREGNQLHKVVTMLCSRYTVKVQGSTS